VQPRALSRAVLSVTIGLIALALSWAAGFVISGLQGVTALAAVFVLAVVATMFGPGRVAQAVRSHPLLTLALLVVVTLLVVLVLMSPTYTMPMVPEVP
jgi:hypothetical protein